MKLQTLNQQNYLNPKTTDLSTKLDLILLSKALKIYKCNGCNLGSQEKLYAPVLYRGSINSKIMVIAESPGQEEDRLGKPLVGPSGILLDKMFSYIGLDTNKDCYLTNTVKCRNICSNGSKQNNTVTKEQCCACRPYLEHEIKLINPKIIVLLGKVAIDNFFPSKNKMRQWVGQTRIHNNNLFYLYLQLC